MKTTILIMLFLIANIAYAESEFFDDYLDYFKSIGIEAEGSNKLLIFYFPYDILQNCGNDKIDVAKIIHAKENTKSIIIITELEYNSEVEKLLYERYDVEQIIFAGYDDFIDYEVLPSFLLPMLYIVDIENRDIKADFGIYGHAIDLPLSVAKTIDFDEYIDYNVINKYLLHVNKVYKQNNYYYFIDYTLNRLLILDENDKTNPITFDINTAFINLLISKEFIQDASLIKAIEDNAINSISISNLSSQYDTKMYLTIQFSYTNSQEIQSEVLIIVKFENISIISVDIQYFDDSFPFVYGAIIKDDCIIGTHSIDTLQVGSERIKVHSTIGVQQLNDKSNFDRVLKLDSIYDINTIEHFLGILSSLDYGFQSTNKYIYLFGYYYPTFIRFSLNNCSITDISLGYAYGTVHKQMEFENQELKNKSLIDKYSRKWNQTKVSSMVAVGPILTFLSDYKKDGKKRSIYLTKYIDDEKPSETKYVFRDNDIVECHLLYADTHKAEILVKTIDNNWKKKTIIY